MRLAGVRLAGARLAGAMALSRLAGSLARRSGRGGGTSLPGRLLLRLAPGAITQLAGRLSRGSVVISATNGKTTTAAMVASILGGEGIAAVHNRAGANMTGGVASTLLGAATLRGEGMRGDLGLFEVDELWLDELVEALRPRALVLGNLFRDQLDRYGELETIGDRWAGVLANAPPDLTPVLCADDPLISALGGESPGQPLWFGVGDDAPTLGELPHASDSTHCRRCGQPLVYEAVYLGHLGRYSCPTGDHDRPDPAVSATRVELSGVRTSAFILTTPAGTRRVRLPLPGLYNVYNALAAAALATALDVTLDAVVAGLESVAPAFGRAETIPLGDRQLSVLLVKNPTGANEVLRTLASEPGEHDLLAVLNDGIADGRDVSWVWDADFELLAGHLRQVTCAGTRAAEMALRLKYAGVDPARIRVADGLAGALDAALADGAGPLYALPTYTALLELRELLSRRGAAPEYWR